MPVFNQLQDDDEHLADLQDRRDDWVYKKTLKPWDATYQTPGAKFTAMQFAWNTQILLDGELSKNAIRVAGFLCLHLNSKTNDAFPSHEWLAILMGVTEKWVGKGMRELEKRGHVEVERKAGRVNHYTLEWVDLDPAESGDTTCHPADVGLSGDTAHAPTPEQRVPPVGAQRVPPAEEQYVPPNTSNLNSSNSNTSKKHLGVSHEEEDRESVENEIRPAEEPDDLETRLDQLDDASASCASARFTGWDDRPADKSARPSREDPTEQPASADVLNMFAGLVGTDEKARHRTRMNYYHR
jgi:hypothetical protein